MKLGLSSVRWTVGGLLWASGAVALIAGCGTEPPDESLGVSQAPLSAEAEVDRAALALRWAPIHYQDVDQTGRHALGGAADYLAGYDFDGDLELRNNWQHAGNPAYPLAARVYYSVTQTSTHWFIVYMFFHPRDWSDTFFDTEHENDAEGVLLAVRRDGSPFGALKSAVTVAHTDFFSYLPAGSDWLSGSEGVDGPLPMAAFGGALHPVTAQQAKGHGLKARGGYDIVGDGVVYNPSLTTAGVPTGPNDRAVSYQLVDIFRSGGLWAQRSNPTVFAGFGAFAGDKSDGCGAGTLGCDENAANPPWGWDDHNDGPVRGALASDPATLVRNYFVIPEVVSAAYTFNPYQSP